MCTICSQPACSLNQALCFMMQSKTTASTVAESIIVKRELIRQLERDLQDARQAQYDLERQFSHVLYYALDHDCEHAKQAEEQEEEAQQEEEEDDEDASHK
ncbi:hypothetical protein BD626DRAFT_574671 [Schizophyllum amplum]|uniref:Uncharacterized protein n=1 Tax=Schizophyllum amplum TaxID=97359 RepID=A0A550BU19_9AGAR|nr:hypothetical protein BD626DRAFT_577379 [Auriculariopsis ampla]TRM56040.1 hypothetical protein BD626DRAFT_576206 [Auriculariopsis ampla]TRM57359.1 hypothetical protein BD626DRAFT_574671 [Auriculariopsis ampla]